VREALTIEGLDHVQVAAPAGCEAAARAFYGGLLGLAELPKPPLLAARGGLWFALGAQELHVGVAEPFAPATKAHPGIAVADEASLRALAADLESAGHRVTWADPVEIPGRTRFHVADPWGNRLELLAPGD
jgi:catechol 2,3-dioxygenase-like lactoylglutathione lyase family enzyme